MRHESFVSLCIAESLGHGEKEQSPAVKPAFGGVTTVGRFEDRHDFSTTGGQVRPPRLGRSLIVRAAPAPLPHNWQASMERWQLIFARQSWADELGEMCYDSLTSRLDAHK